MTEITAVIRLHRSNSVDGLRDSVESLLEQTRRPHRILLLEDETVSGVLYERAREYCRTHSVVSVDRRDRAMNRGEALRVAVEAASTELVAVLDCGDIAVADRLESQRQYMEANERVDVVGGYVAEFEDDPDDPYAVREVPTEHDEIEAFARTRSPINQPTVCFRREAVRDVGNYRSLDQMEDYDLWVRMLSAGKVFANLPRILTRVRAGESLYVRRGGVRYLSTELWLHWTFYRRGFISLWTLLWNVSLRTPVRLLPPRYRAFVYNRVAR